jgi:alpha-1,6-mannosyltransferase
VKVLDVTEFYSERGGGVRSHLTLKGHISCQLGHQHIVVAPGPGDSDEWLDEMQQVRQTQPVEPMQRSKTVTRARVVRIGGPALPYDPTYHLLWRVDKVERLVIRESPDVLEIHSPYAAAAACLMVPRRHFGVRTFVWHSDFIDTYLRVMLEDQLGLRKASASFVLEPLWGMVRRIASRCDATFVAAKWIEAKLKSHGVPRVVRLPFGIDRRAFSSAAKSEETRRSLLGDRPDAALFVAVGRFAVEKRWDVVLDAFDQVRRERPLVLALFGDGPERGALERRARTMGGSVRLMGFETDRGKLAAALASADLLVHGCPYETFGFAVAEAMSSGLPAVVPDQGGAAELGDDSWSERYSAGDATACAHAIRRMLARMERESANESENGRSTLRDHALRAAERLPTVQDQFEATYEAYARLLQEHAHERGTTRPQGLSSRE